MNFMQKSVLAAGMTLAMGAVGVAQAMTITVTKMEFYADNGTPQFFSGGLNTSVVGTVNSEATGSINSGTSPFLGISWTADQVLWNATAGAANWSGTSATGAFDYDYTLNAGEVAVGLYFAWGVSSEIAVLQIFDCTSVPGVCSGVNNSPYANVPGTPMDNGPFLDHYFTFSGITSEVPVPAAVWLLGSGLLGLVGVARRRKQ